MPTDAPLVSLKQMEAMRAGAQIAARTCMNITPADRVFVVTDKVTHGIGRLLGEEASEAGGEVLVHDLEQYAERPLTGVPEELRSDLKRFRPTVTFYAASSQPGEVAFRTALRTFILDEIKARHAHMPGINTQLMQEGMRTDYRQVASVTTAVYDMARYAERIRVTTPDGTQLIATFDPALRWVNWGNLPEGEIFTSPKTLDGILVAHIIGDYFSAKYGVLAQPVTFVIRDGRVTDVRGEDRTLVSELVSYLDSAENGRRAGEFAIGTNIGLRKLTGNLLQDEKLPGIHVAFGNPYPAETGANWSSPLHVDVIPLLSTIEVDGETIMQNGRFDYELLGVAAPRG
jgi:aminopeptidase